MKHQHTDLSESHTSGFLRINTTGLLSTCSSMLQRASFSLPKERLVFPTLWIIVYYCFISWYNLVRCSDRCQVRFEKSHFCNINVVSLTLIVPRRISCEIYQSTSLVLWCGTGDSVCNAGGDYREGNGTLWQKRCADSWGCRLQWETAKHDENYVWRARRVIVCNRWALLHW